MTRDFIKFLKNLEGKGYIRLGLIIDKLIVPLSFNLLYYTTKSYQMSRDFIKFLKNLDGKGYIMLALILDKLIVPLSFNLLDNTKKESIILFVVSGIGLLKIIVPDESNCLSCFNKLLLL